MKSSNVKIPAFAEAPARRTRLWQAGLRAGKSQMNVKFQEAIPESETLNWLQGKVRNDILAMPNQVLNLIQDLRFRHLI